MRLDLYHAECVRIADEQTALLDEVKLRIQSGTQLTRLEQNGVLHSFQILIENAIGKAKHLLKASGRAVPVSAYDAFAVFEQQGEISAEAMQQWNSTIGLRNRIVHDYMNIDMQFIYELIINDRHQFIAMFLRLPIDTHAPYF